MIVFLDTILVIHLATAIEAGCSLFLTNDQRLSGFPDIPIEVLT